MVLTLEVKAKDKLGKNEPRGSKGYLRSMLVEFCKRTDLHGYKYIVMEDLNVFERSFWALAVLISIGCAAYFVVTAYNWYARNPIVTVIESTQGAIWDIPFPAVTICNLNIVSKRAAHFLAYNMSLPGNVTALEVFEAFRQAPLLQSQYSVSTQTKEILRQLQTVLDYNHMSIENMFRQLSPANPCAQLLERCMWKNSLYSCDTLFQQVPTQFNFCCAFNYFAIKEKSPSTVPDRPRRVASCGYQTALTVLINVEPWDYYSAPMASQGSFVIIDNAYNLPNVDSPLRLVNPSTEVLIALSPESTYTTAGIRAFKPQERQCYYNDEFKVGNFRHYSFHNCITYQRVQVIKNVCECMPYYFPVKDLNYRQCNFNDIDCLEKVITQIDADNYPVLDKSYKCLPECEHYNYPMEVAFGNIASKVHLEGNTFLNEVNLRNRSLVNVFFNDLVSTRYRRDVYLNWQNLLASFGGLLSLMLGFTLIAGFDLLLFFTFGIAYGSFNSTRNKLNRGPSKVKTNRINVQNAKRHIEQTPAHLSKKDISKWQEEAKYGDIKY